MIYLDSVRKKIVEAISSGFPILSIATLFKIDSFSLSDKSLSSGQRIAPGAIALTLTSGASSLAKDLVIPSNAALAPEYRLNCSIPFLTKLSVMLITHPFTLFRCITKACIKNIGVVTFVFVKSFQSSNEALSMGVE